MALFVGLAAGLAYLAGLLITGNDSFAIYAIVGSLVYVLISYFTSSRLALALNGAHEVSKKDEPRLYRIVENLTITNGMPMPRVYVIEDPALNAFATGRNPEVAVVCATRGLLDVLEDNELEGVMAHELGHVKNYDIRVSLVAFALVSVIAVISDIVLRAFFWGGINKDENNGSSGAILMIIGLIATILAPFAAMLIQLAISRQREYLADATGALTTRYPDGLANALKKISLEGSTLKKQNSSTAHLFFANPLKKGSLNNLFSTHPPIEERIKRLNEMGGKL